MDLKENLHENNFEDFIKNKIESFDELPSSDLWNRIEGVIPPKPKPVIVKYMKPISVAASVVLVAGLWAFVYQFQSQNEALSKKLDEASEQIEVLNQQVQELNNVPEEVATVDENQTIALPSNDIQKIANNDAETIKSISTTNTIKDNKNTKSPLKSSNVTIIPPKMDDNMVTENSSSDVSTPMAVNGAETSNDILQENNQTVPSLKNGAVALDKQLVKSESEAIANIDFLEIKSLSKLPNDASTMNKTLPIVNEAPTKRTVVLPDLSNWSMTLSAAPLWARSNKRPKPGQPQPPNDKKAEEMIEMGQSLGLRVNYQISKRWAVSGGLSRQNEVVRLKLRDRISYNKNGELDFDPEFTISNHNYETNSNYGDMGITLDLFRDKSRGEINEGAPIELELKGFHRKTSMNIPIIAQYCFNPESKVRIGLKGGLAAQLLLKNEFEPIQVDVSEEGVIAQGISLVQPPQLSQRASVDGVFGAQMMYQFHEHFQLNVEPTLVWSLTDKHRSPNGNTKSGYGAAQIGLTYLF